MKPKQLAICLFILCLALLTSCTVPLNSDPILAVGHGAFIGANGEEFTPNVTLIQSVQTYYIDTLLKQPDAQGDKAHIDSDLIQATQKRIDSLVEDKVLANALLIDWLLENVQPTNVAHLTSVNNALRWYYVLDILREQIAIEENVWTKGIPLEIAEELERSGIPTIVFLTTNAGGRQYIEECRNAGVPIPPPMYSAAWNFQGTIDGEFISEAGQTDLWRYTSESPAGVCLSLPRYFAESDFREAELFGLICLGTQSNKACFWDNPQGKSFARDVEVDISEFVGGVDLDKNAQGICSDCHAGENPYVVHPEKPPFVGLTASLMPLGWHDPLVHPNWPQNPGPTNLLDVVGSTGRCDSCHFAGSAGRFPDVSTQLPGYCGTILGTATGSSPKRTMPPFGANPSQFTAHINALKAACGAPPTGGGVVVEVDFPDDTGFVSPPIVIDPLYQCATQVAVRGAILDAKVELFINGTSVGSQIARNPTKEEFTVPALVVSDVVTAVQELNGVPSMSSPPVTVRDHTVDFPAGLPAPEIDPTLIYQCSDIIAVRHVPGANITVFSNGGDPRSSSTSIGWTVMFPAKQPFDVNDTFTAEAELCGDISVLSAPQSAVVAPTTLPAATLKPVTVYDGQQLVTVENITHGARVSIAEASFGALGNFTWPVSWFPNFDVATPFGGPLSAGDKLLVSLNLCSLDTRTETPPVEECSALPAPRIRHPLVGEQFVVVTDSVPGARIRVSDDSGDELGDGSGTVIWLKRPLTGVDIITVVQQLTDKCTSSTGYRVSVRNPGAGDNN